MFFLRLLLISFILITHAESDTIYSLIGIRNLEILKKNGKENIVYLKANGSFQAGLKENNVTCFAAKDESFRQKFALIEESINGYNSNFFKKINLRYIVLCEDLTIAGINATGIANSEKKTIIINIKIEPEILQRIVHHEIFHIINDSFDELFSEKNWKNINDSTFKYADCSTCTKQLGLFPYNKTDGFITEYSKSTASEDMAETFSFLKSNKKILINKASKDIILKQKVSFILEGIQKIDKEFKF